MYRSEYSANVALATGSDFDRIVHTTPEQNMRDALALADASAVYDKIVADRQRDFLFAR